MLIVDVTLQQKNVDVDFGEFVCNGGEDRFSVALFKFGEHDKRFHIGPQIEKVLWRNLASHDCAMNFVLAKKFEQSPQLSDPQPLNNIDMLRNRRIGFVGERGRDDFLYASFVSGGSQNPWINAVARDDSENLRCLHSDNLAEQRLFLRDAETNTRDACAIHGGDAV